MMQMLCNLSLITSPLNKASLLFFFFFNDTATTEIYTLSLHDALPIYPRWRRFWRRSGVSSPTMKQSRRPPRRSEEHTSELQSQSNIVCRLLLEKKNNMLPIDQMAHYRLVSADVAEPDVSCAQLLLSDA